MRCDIFVTYAHEDQARVLPLVEALERAGWKVFWDRRIPAGKTWRDHIGRALADARCVVVAWSRHSVESQWVMDEADDAQRRGLMVPVRLDPVEPPLGFRAIQAADLIDVRSLPDSLPFQQLVSDIRALMDPSRISNQAARVDQGVVSEVDREAHRVTPDDAIAEQRASAGAPQRPAAPPVPTQEPETARPDAERGRVESAHAGPDGGMSEMFLRAWRLYPQRPGTNPQSPAWQAWRARCRASADPAVEEAAMLEGVRRYLRFVTATEATLRHHLRFGNATESASESVIPAQQFFGPAKEYERPWTLPAQRIVVGQARRRGLLPLGVLFALVAAWLLTSGHVLPLVFAVAAGVLAVALLLAWWGVGLAPFMVLDDEGVHCRWLEGKSVKWARLAAVTVERSDLVLSIAVAGNVPVHTVKLSLVSSRIKAPELAELLKREMERRSPTGRTPDAREGRAAEHPQLKLLPDGPFIEIDGGLLYLGRDSHLATTIPALKNKVVSNRHCCFERGSDGQWTIEDLGSTNGTWLRGNRITRREQLRSGDVVTLGHDGPRLEYQPQPEAAEATIVETAAAKTTIVAPDGSAEQPYRVGRTPEIKLRHERTGTVFEATGYTIVIGRDPAAAQVVIRSDEEKHVSGRHAEIQFHADGSVVVRDLGSRNGTWLNDHPLKAEAPIKIGDHLVLGSRLTVLVVAALET